jgi:toxin YoeB
MNHNITFTPISFENYKEWATTDKQIFKKINEIIHSIDRTPFEGIGKPEPLELPVGF